MKASFIATLVGATAVAAADCPAAGSTDSQGRYSCNLAHQYPNGQTCAVVDGCPFLVGPDGKPVDNSPAQPSQTAAACPAAGSTDSKGRYSCNPAHQYPNGQTCGEVDGCPYLLGPDGKPVNNSPATTAAQPTETTAACPAAGSTDSKGRYSCNPAHQYPNGQTCGQVDGCLFLLGPDGKPVINSPAKPSETAAACPAPGSTDSQGRYSCNPAHQYPNGQSCVAFQGCYFLCGSDGKPVDNAPAPTETAAACPAPGSTDSQGRYSCNPAHQYPNGQSCVAFQGCYFLCGSDGKPVDNGPAPTTGAVQPPQPSGAACPAPGSTDSQGRYSCNPAHQYPSGQTCTVVDGCYVLTSGDKPVNNNNGTTPAQPPVTAGAASLQAAGALVLAAFGLLL
ncbi:hypothetical protein MAA_04414 [Metarhizium robertsii ARSEF 23]|uniref:Uncharacterized protein n=2 Tax=Metarhizium robertsii TaxID=568076 RepID=E9EWL5_METRA|nr:uncharacterized protein MAA_04414 [Metarhizium robertsii ARSEF 23]EFZ00637.1 hypothetical protein MAA_04414 [Metarhizium robertsii ARSEF 23]